MGVHSLVNTTFWEGFIHRLRECFESFKDVFPDGCKSYFCFHTSAGLSADVPLHTSLSQHSTCRPQVAQGVGPSGLLDSWTLGGSAAAARKPHHGADWPVVLPTGRAVGTAGAYWGEGMCLGKRKRKQRERASAERKPGNVTETRMTIEHWRPLGAKTVGHTLALHSAESEAPERMSEDRAKTEARTRRGKEMETGRPIRSANEQFEL